MRPARVYEDWQKDYLAQNAATSTLKELSDHLKIPLPSISKYCEENRLLTKNAHNKKRKEFASTPSEVKRPASVYTQSASPYGIASNLH